MSRMPRALLLPALIALGACDSATTAPSIAEPEAQFTVLSDAEIASAWSGVGAIIASPRTGTTLTTHFASAGGNMNFVATDAGMTTTERLYKNGEIVAYPSSYPATYDGSATQIAADAISLSNGSMPFRYLSTSIDPIAISSTCGYRVTATSTHSASAIWAGVTLGTAQTTSSATPKSLPNCPPPSQPPGGGGDGHSQTCYTLTVDHYYYYPDTGEVEYVGTDTYSWCEA